MYTYIRTTPVARQLNHTISGVVTVELLGCSVILGATTVYKMNYVDNAIIHYSCY